MGRTKRDILIELLVVQAQSGDDKAIGELSALMHAPLVAHAANLIGDAEAAKDAVQEAWIAILRGIKKLRDPAAFRPWAYRIVHHKAIDTVRRDAKSRKELNEFRRMHSGGEQSLAGEDCRVSLEAESELELLREAIRELSHADQAVLRLYYEDRLSIREISYVTGTSTSALKSKLFHLRRKLKKQIERQNHAQEQH